MTLVGGAAAWPLSARTAAASAHRVPVAQLYRERLPTKTAFVEGLRALDYVEGQTIEVHYRYADGDTTKLVALGRQLVALQPAVALATSISPAIAMKSVAPELPIVCPLLGVRTLPHRSDCVAIVSCSSFANDHDAAPIRRIGIARIGGRSAWPDATPRRGRARQQISSCRKSRW
jgi:hypothetical protein